MTKRRVESSSLHEAPLQKKRRSVCDAEHELEAGNALHALHAADAAAAPPALFTTLIGERRRKRPRGCEDYEQHGRTEAQADGVNTETEDVRISGKFRRAGGACTYEKASKECASGTKPEERTKVPTPHHALVMPPADDGDELCAFNAFQFWRTPLPALDLSLLDSQSTTQLNEDSSRQDATEEMEA